MKLLLTSFHPAVVLILDYQIDFVIVDFCADLLMLMTFNQGHFPLKFLS